MPGYEVVATFPDSRRAHSARQQLARSHRSVVISASELTDLSSCETRFIGRFVLVIIGWSIVGTLIGAALGVAIALALGETSTEGLLLQVVSWAIFAHVLIGMWAGYLLLTDRMGPDLRATSPTVVLRAECATIDESRELAAEMQALGASSAEAGETNHARYRI
jgi:hypothetical protein